MKIMRKCKDCGHEIFYKVIEVNGEVQRVCKHKKGGTYCHVSNQFPVCGDCLCNRAGE